MADEFLDDGQFTETGSTDTGDAMGEWSRVKAGRRPNGALIIGCVAAAVVLLAVLLLLD